MEYTFRLSAFTKEKTFSLLENEIKSEEKGTGKIERIRYNQVKEVILSYGNSKNMPDMYFCQVKGSNGETLKLRSQHFKGYANFESRNESYTIFVRELHHKLANYQQVIFRKGISEGMYYFSLFFAVVGIIALVAIGIITFFTSDFWYWIVFLIATPLLAIKLRDYLKKNKPGVYSADAIPEELLPS